MSHYRIRSIPHLTCLTTALALAGCTDDSGGSSASDTDGGIASATGTEGETRTNGGSDPTTQTTTSDTEDDGSGDDELNCGEVEVQLDAAPGRVMLLVDKSYSMVSNSWDHDADPQTDPVTRWFSLHAVVDNITGNFDNSIDFGVLLYPSTDAPEGYVANACVVNDDPEVPVGPSNAQAIMAALPNATADLEIRGGTPSRVAVEVALDHLRTFDMAVPRAILYITDGEANCSPDAGSLNELFEEYDDGVHPLVESAWLDDGIPTYVVGIAIRDEILETAINGAPNNINPHEKLNELAEDGGVPRAGEVKYYQTDNEFELQEALEEIAAEQVSCVIELDPPPEHPNFVTVEIDGETIPQVDDCASEDGWVFHEPEDGVYHFIELCGAACDQLVAVGLIDATYGCPPPM
jgi:hypothetical protein